MRRPRRRTQVTTDGLRQGFPLIRGTENHGKSRKITEMAIPGNHGKSRKIAEMAIPGNHGKSRKFTEITEMRFQEIMDQRRNHGNHGNHGPDPPGLFGRRPDFAWFLHCTLSSSLSTGSDLQQFDTPPPPPGHGNGQKDSDKKLGWRCTEKLGCILVYRGKWREIQNSTFFFKGWDLFQWISPAQKSPKTF